MNGFDLPRERGRIRIPIGQRFDFLNFLLRQRGAPPIPAGSRLDDRVLPQATPETPPPIVPPAPTQGPPVGLFPGFGQPPPQFPIALLAPGAVDPAVREAMRRAATRAAPKTPGLLRVIVTNPIASILIGILFPAPVARGVPTPEEIRRMEEAFEPPQPVTLPEIQIPTLPRTAPEPFRLPTRRPQRAIPSPTPTPARPIERRPFPVERPPPVEIPPEPVQPPRSVPAPRPFLFPDPVVDTPVPEPADPGAISAEPATRAPTRTVPQTRTPTTPGTLVPPFFIPSSPGLAPDLRLRTSRSTPTQTPTDTTTQATPLTPSRTAPLTSQPGGPARQCQEVTRRRRRKGKCREGFFRELPGKTQFITWREGDCLGIARRGAESKIRDAFQTVGDVLGA